MKLIEALSGHSQAAAERGQARSTVRVSRQQTGYVLTHTVLDQTGYSVVHTWQFASLYDLVQFARRAGPVEVDLEATNWERVAEA
jgi:hypothetical protein